MATLETKITTKGEGFKFRWLDGEEKQQRSKTIYCNHNLANELLEYIIQIEQQKEINISEKIDKFIDEHKQAENEPVTVVDEKLFSEENNIVNEGKAKQIVYQYMGWSLGAGLFPIPILDMVAVSAVQLKMVSDLSQHFNVEFSKNKGKAIISSLLVAVVPFSVAQGASASALKFIPIVGNSIGGISMSAFAAAASYAIGSVFIKHFESGGTLLDFDANKFNAYFKEMYKQGQKIIQDKVKSLSRKKATPVPTE